MSAIIFNLVTKKIKDRNNETNSVFFPTILPGFSKLLKNLQQKKN